MIRFLVLIALLSGTGCSNIDFFEGTDTVGNFVFDKTDEGMDQLVRVFGNWCKFSRAPAEKEFLKALIAEAVERCQARGASDPDFSCALAGPPVIPCVEENP